MAHHRIGAAEFDALAAGVPDATAVESLRRSRLSRVLLLIRQIAIAHPEHAEVVRVLTDAQDADPDAVSAVLTCPWVGVWAARCARHDQAVDNGHFRNVGAAAALRAGLPAAAREVVRAAPGPLALPTLGVVSGALEPLHPLRTVPLDGGFRLDVDDVDPYRDCHLTPAAPRLDGPGWRAWRSMIEAAWDLLAVHAKARAAEIAAGLRAVVPLAGDGVSVTHGDAFGGFGASLAGQPSEFAATIVHEFQHSKINALLDLVPLYDDPAAGRYFAPWRPDPRPLSGMIQGIAAFTAVADLWRAFRSDPLLERAATARFAALRAQVVRAVAEIRSAPELTPAGVRFVSGLDAAAHRLLEHPVPASADRAAHTDLATVEARWHQRWS